VARTAKEAQQIYGVVVRQVWMCLPVQLLGVAATPYAASPLRSVPAGIHRPRAPAGRVCFGHTSQVPWGVDSVMTWSNMLELSRQN
jgi:hypothetical protein